MRFGTTSPRLPIVATGGLAVAFTYFTRSESYADKRKAFVSLPMLSSGSPRSTRSETLEESDAFTCANYGLSELGGYCLCQVAA
jgi:hypothetical protein